MLATETTPVLVNPVTKQELTILDRSPERLVMESRLVPFPERPPLHHHPFQDERFTVLEGWCDFTIGEETRRYESGAVVEIPRGTDHEMSGDARVRWEVAPALRTAEFFELLFGMARRGEVGPKGIPGPLTTAAIVREFSDEIRLAGVPWPLQRALLAVAGRLRRVPTS